MTDVSRLCFNMFPSCRCCPENRYLPLPLSLSFSPLPVVLSAASGGVILQPVGIFDAHAGGGGGEGGGVVFDCLLCNTNELGMPHWSWAAR